MCLVGCALVWFGGDVLAVPVPVTSHPPPLSVAVVQIEVNGASSLSPSLPLVCSSRFYVSRVVIVLPTEMTIGVVLYTYLSFVYLNTCLGCLAREYCMGQTKSALDGIVCILLEIEI